MSFDPNKPPPEPSLKQTLISVILFTLSVLVVAMIGGVAITYFSDGDIFTFWRTEQMDWIFDWLDGLL